MKFNSDCYFIHSTQYNMIGVNLTSSDVNHLKLLQVFLWRLLSYYQSDSQDAKNLFS